jgi:hypothetical protein
MNEDQIFKNKKSGIKCKIDKCEGYLDDLGICYTCHEKHCSKCYELDEETHECDSNILKNIEYIKENSKKCPKCSIFIEKKHGCSSMFCINCHTFFDWDSGDITYKGHNPEYEDFLNYKERQIGEVLCGREINYDILLKIRYDFDLYKICDGIIKWTKRLLDITQRDNYDLRNRFEKGEISIKHFETVLYKRDKRREFLEVRNKILNEFIQNLTETIYFYEMKDDNDTSVNSNHIDELKLCFENLSKIYTIQYFNLVKIYNYTREYNSLLNMIQS